MQTEERHVKRLLAVAVLMAGFGLAATPARAFAQADEIQVYDGGLAPKGVFNLTVHNNLIAKGIKTTPFPGGVTADQSFNGVPEWAYGVTNWFEAGLYLPLYTHDKNLGFGFNGFKLRTLFATPNGADRKVALGANFEFSYNAKRWDTTRITSEIRPIVAFHVNPKFDFIVNPILDTAYDGLGNLEFVPAVRASYMPKPDWALSLETYSGFGTINGFQPVHDQAHQLFGVLDHTTKSGFEMEFGVGVGLTDASDKLTFKMILARDLNKPKIKK
jgi:hypothetical protein